MTSQGEYRGGAGTAPDRAAQGWLRDGSETTQDSHTTMQVRTRHHRDGAGDTGAAQERHRDGAGTAQDSHTILHVRT